LINEELHASFQTSKLILFPGIKKMHLSVVHSLITKNIWLTVVLEQSV